MTLPTIAHQVQKLIGACNMSYNLIYEAARDYVNALDHSQVQELLDNFPSSNAANIVIDNAYIVPTDRNLGVANKFILDLAREAVKETQ